MTVGSGGEGRCNVVAEKSNRGNMSAVANGEGAPGVGAVLRAAQRRGWAEGDARQINMILRPKTCHGSAEGRG
jgi:hypothetical protein